MNHPAALEELLHSPRLPEYSRIIQDRLALETARRLAFYAEMTDERKTEFIDGEVIVHSPARNWHLNAARRLLVLLDAWVGTRRCGLVHIEKALCVFQRNDYEPDIVYFGAEKAALILPDTLRFPVPDFVVEVLSESTEPRDRGIKFEDYAAHGVAEYWIIDPVAETLEQFVLATNGTYELRLKSGSGEITSTILNGFVIPIRAVFNADTNRETLARLLTSPET